METDSKMTRMLELDKYFQASFMTLFNNVKKNMLVLYERLQYLRKWIETLKEPTYNSCE